MPTSASRRRPPAPRCRRCPLARTATEDDRPAMNGTVALHVEELAASYGPVRALDGVSLSVAAGSVTAVLGANGAGKTSLLRSISGLVRPRTGRIRLHG